MTELLSEAGYEVDEDSPEILRHLEHLVSMYPETYHQDNVYAVLAYCKETLQATGSFQDAEILEHEGKYSLVGSTQGKKHNKVMLQAHVDVVEADEDQRHMTTDKEDPDKLKGRGVYDMLFAVASYLHFVESNKDKLANMDLGIMLTGDEEIGGFDGVEWLIQEGYSADVVILPDGGEEFGELNDEAKGIHRFALAVNGVRHHSSRPWEGDGAANKVVRVLHELLDEFEGDDPDGTTMTIMFINSGHAKVQSLGPADAAAYVDIRAGDEKELERIKEKIAAVCDQYGVSVESLLEARVFKTDRNNPHVRSFVDLYRRHTGRDTTYSKSPGTSDGRHFPDDTAVLLFRPEGGKAHGKGEYLSKKSLLEFYKLLGEYVLKTATIETDD